MQPILSQIRLQDPTTLLIVLAIVLIVLLIAILVVSIGRRRARNEREVDELLAAERRNRFLAAAETLPFSGDPTEIAQAIAAIFRDYLAIRVLGFFAGREGEAQLENLLFRNHDLDEPGSTVTHLLPTSVSADVLAMYRAPQYVPLGQFPGGHSPGHPAPNVEPDVASEPLPEGGTAPPSEADIDLANTEAAHNRESAAASIHRSESVAVLPLKGPLGWHGLMVLGFQGQTDLSDLLVVYEFQAALSSRFAVALELDRRTSGASAAVEQQSRISDFMRAMPAFLPVESHLPDALAAVTKLLGADTTAYWRVDAQTKTVNMIAADNLNASDFLPAPIGRGFCGAVVETMQPLVIEDALADPRCLFPGQCKEAGIASYLGVPVFSGKDVTGVLEVHTNRPHRWNEGNVAALKIAAAAMETKTSHGQTGPLGLRAETAYIALSEALQGLGSRTELLEAAVEVVGHAVGASRTLILQPENASSGDKPAYVVRYEFCSEDATSAMGRSLPEESLRRAFDSEHDRTPLVIDDSKNESLMPAPMLEELGVLSEVAVPIKTGDEAPWLLWVHRCDYQRAWSPEEVTFVERVARQIAIARTNIEALEKASNQAEAARAEAKHLKEAAKRSRDLLDALPEAVVGLDREGRITFFNRYGKDSFGLKDDDLGRMADMTEALSMSEDAIWDRVGACQSAARFAANLSSTGASLTGAPAGRGPGDSSAKNGRPVSLLVAPTRDDGGAVNGRIVVIADEAPSDAGKKAEVAAANAAALQGRINELEKSLTETQSRFNQAVAAESKSSANAAALLDRIKLLESSLSEKESRLNKAMAAESEASANTAALQARITELEKSLAEAHGSLSKAAAAESEFSSTTTALQGRIQELEKSLTETQSLLTKAVAAESESSSTATALQGRVQ
ncbi:MAG TPA: GAF domain-containing protein, partial [Blastocatellia bacterium]|nr:GAF domain-containing protein [Blastocatellia bacterium]